MSESTRELEARLAAFEAFIACIIPSLPDRESILARLDALQRDPALSRRAAVCAHLNRLHQLLRAVTDTPPQSPAPPSH